MKKLSLLLLILGFSVLACAVGLKPAKKAKVVKVTVAGKSYTYYLAKKGGFLDFKVGKAKRLKIFVRTSLTKNTAGWVDIYINGQKYKRVKIKHDKSRKAYAKGVSAITKATVVKLKAPRVAKKIRIRGDGDILVRAVTMPKSFVVIQPIKSAGTLSLINNEREFIYSKATSSKPAEYTIFGSGAIVIYSRLIYQPGMLGTQRYSLVVTVDGKKTVYDFETEKSSQSYFRNDKKLLPSRANKVRIKLSGKSVHKIVIKPTGGDVAVRLLAQKSMVKR